jgi:hypothetical protein
MNEQEKLIHEYLLADFRAIKDEIARRSNLQRIALAALGVFYTWLLNAFAAKSAASLHIAALWVVTVLFCIFHYRESLEIKRLGGIIRNKIAEPASKLLNFKSQKLLPSEMDAEEPGIDKWTRFYNIIFWMLVCLAIPSVITIYFAMLKKCT